MKVQLAVCCTFLAVATATPFDVTAFGAVGDGVTGQNIADIFVLPFYKHLSYSFFLTMITRWCVG